MNKQRIITKIKNELSAHSLNIGEDTFQSCPIHKQISKNEEILIETIYSDGVEATYYVHGNAIDMIWLQFDEISNENLQLILENILEANSFLEN